jgi:dUTP pyrophosphatase
MYLRYATTRDVKDPQRGHWPDAGIDFFIPNDFDAMTLAPGENVLIPSGVKVEIPPGYMGLFLNKSGVASKKELLIGAQVIDPYYAGEVHIDLHNVGKNRVELRPGDKIVQMILVPISHCQLTLSDETDLYSDYVTDEFRGKNGFGSTDRKEK